MIQLIFVACLSGEPANCRTERLLYADVAPMTCLLGAQGELAGWAAGNPDWRVVRWACLPFDRRAART